MRWLEFNLQERCDKDCGLLVSSEWTTANCLYSLNTPTKSYQYRNLCSWGNWVEEETPNGQEAISCVLRKTNLQMNGTNCIERVRKHFDLNWQERTWSSQKTKELLIDPTWSPGKWDTLGSWALRLRFKEKKFLFEKMFGALTVKTLSTAPARLKTATSFL